MKNELHKIAKIAPPRCACLIQKVTDKLKMKNAKQIYPRYSFKPISFFEKYNSIISNGTKAMKIKTVKFVIGGQLIKNRKPERIDRIIFLNI